jgi:peptidoglycan/LPS O-acetylase OafA/YrhL
MGGPRRYPNFDVLRLAAASSVIFSHAYLLVDGSERREPFVRLLGDHNILGLYGVYTFFVMSGFLVSGSLDYSGSIVSYLMKRALRIYPGLFVSALLVSIAVGAAFTSLPLHSYFGQGQWLRYATTMVALPNFMTEIPTVSFDGAAPGFGPILNGALWTIPQELFCYGALALLALLRANRLPVLMVLAMLPIWCSLNRIGYSSKWTGDFLVVAPAFFAGAAVYKLPEDLRGRGDMAVAGIAILLIAAATGYQLWAFPVAAAYPLLALATSTRLRLPDLRRVGDMSFGAYLYGWPVEQVVRSQLGSGAKWWLVFAISLPIALLMGYLSWHLVEKHALRLGRGRPKRSVETSRAGRARGQAVEIAAD